MPDERDPRPEPPTQGGELVTLVGFLRWQRATLEVKCAGLDAAQLATRSVEPSSMSLLGMVRHMAEVERSWFRTVMSGEEQQRIYRTADDPDGDWDGAVADPDVVAEAWATWRAEVAYADRFVAEARDLEVTGQETWRGAMSLRWVLTHMIEEYARHNGHADLLRERIDGATGQ
jgi:uncharacterized damage-inducible protein DinB